MSKGPFERRPHRARPDEGHEGDDRRTAAGPLPGTDDVGHVLRQGIKSALARWVLTKRRGAARAASRATSSVRPQDEATHAWDRQRRFAEDYTFVGVQPGLAVILRLEHLPGRDSQRVWAIVLRPEGAYAPAGGQLVLRSTGDDRWRAGGLQLDCETPLRRWSLRFAGVLEHQGQGSEDPRPLRVVDEADQRTRASLDLTFVATAAPYVPGTDDDPELLARRLGEATWDARLLQAARRERPRGYVQLGELHGTIALGDVLVPVRAAALRQHHWGVRDWGACDEAFECFWATDDRRRGWLQHARFPFVTLEGGFVGHTGASRGPSGALPYETHVEPVRRIGATLEARPSGAPARATLLVGEPEGTRHVRLERISDLSFVVDGRGRVDLALVRAAGTAEGWGLWAGLHRALPRR